MLVLVASGWCDCMDNDDVTHNLVMHAHVQFWTADCHGTYPLTMVRIVFQAASSQCQSPNASMVDRSLTDHSGNQV